MNFDQVKDLVAEYNKVQDEFQKKLKNSLQVILNEFLTEYPEIRSIIWTQYTPYFNDGEPCEFRVGDFYAVDANEELSEDTDSPWDFDGRSVYEGRPSEYVYNNQDKYESYKEQITRYENAVNKDPRYGEVSEAWSKMKSLMNSIPSEIFLNAFGDHAKVMATKDGVSVDEYEHD